LKLHKTLTKEKWELKPFFQRILMIGNEVNRLKNAIENKKSQEEILSCVERGLELADITISCEKNRNIRKELLRWREFFGEYYLPENENKEKIKNLYTSLLLFSPEAFKMLN